MNTTTANESRNLEAISLLAGICTAVCIACFLVTSLFA